MVKSGESAFVSARLMIKALRSALKPALARTHTMPFLSAVTVPSWEIVAASVAPLVRKSSTAQVIGLPDGISAENEKVAFF